MTQLLRALPPNTLDDDAWDDLLSFIEERRVIPIVGPELLQVATPSGPKLLYDWLAERLAAKLSVDVTELPQPYTLNDVVCLFLATRGRREEAYVRLRSILRDANLEPSASLRRLAAITDFDLFVSTTFDPLLETAINLERFGGSASTDVVSYAPNRVADLPVERDQLQRPLVYHLFGRVSASPTYVISDEDLLEFICALQNEHLAPERLFHELEHSHLLFLGSNFSNLFERLNCAELIVRVHRRNQYGLISQCATNLTRIDDSVMIDGQIGNGESLLLQFLAAVEDRFMFNRRSDDVRSSRCLQPVRILLLKIV